LNAIARWKINHAQNEPIRVTLREGEQGPAATAAGAEGGDRPGGAVRRTSLSNFMLEHAYEAAQQVLAEQVDIVLSPAEWDAFCKALDAPPRSIPALQEAAQSKQASSMDQAAPPLNSPTLLDARHDLAVFDCGVPALNHYLTKFALDNQRSQAARTYVATRGDRVVGYYTLAAVRRAARKRRARVAKGLAAHPVPSFCWPGWRWTTRRRAKVLAPDC